MMGKARLRKNTYNKVEAKVVGGFADRMMTPLRLKPTKNMDILPGLSQANRNCTGSG
jgi:hypothetical protein